MLPHARRRGKRLRRGEQSNKTQINDRVLFKVKQALQRSERSAGFIPGLHCECDTYWPCDLGRTSLSNQNLLIHESRSGALIEMLILQGFGFCMCVKGVSVDGLMCKYAGILCEKRRVWKPEVGVRCLPQSHYCIYWYRICLSPSPRAHQGSSSLARQFALFCLLRAVITGRPLDIYVGSGTWTLILTVARETLYLLSYLSTSNLEF